MARRVPLIISIVVLFIGAVVSSPTPVIIDTDVGSVFDDSAAIAVALQRPELDVRLILTATGDTTARAQVVAKYLTAINRTDIPIGVGVANANKTVTPLYGWASSFSLSDYPGVVYHDGIGAAIDIVRASSANVTIVAIAPATNFPALLARGGPSFVAKCRVRAMSGSIHRGYNNSPTPTNEYNVKVCPRCTRMMYEAGWSVVATPLDTCGTAVLQGQSFNDWVSNPTPLASVLAQSYVWWMANCNCWWQPGNGTHTDVWYDVVAVYLATLPNDFGSGQQPGSQDSWLHFAATPVTVTPTGFTKVTPGAGVVIYEALSWTDRAAFLDWTGRSIAAPTQRWA